MITSAILATAALLSTQDKPVTLSRVFAKGETAQYKVLSNLQIQSRQMGMQTFMPEDLDINYNFSYQVTDLKADGIAVLRYKRPTMTEITGETFSEPPKTKVVKSNWAADLELTVSPINEIIAIKDLFKKPVPKGKGGKGGGAMFFGPRNGAGAQINIGSFIQELYQLSLLVGYPDSALDFNPKLHFDEVKPGDTWKRTVGYSPQKLKDKSGKHAVQRLDYTYTYKGRGELNGKKIHKVTAELKLDTNVADFINQLYDAKPEETHLKEIKLKLDAKIDFDLDAKTCRTLRALAQSEGGVVIIITDFPNEPIQEMKLKGKTTMSLVSAK